MADATAPVTLTLQDSGFRSTFGGLVNSTKSQSQGMGKAIGDSLSKGAQGGMDALKQSLSSLKNMAAPLLGMLGGLSVGALIKGAVDADEKFRHLAFTMKTSQGELQAHAEGVAKQWKTSSLELAEATAKVHEATGNADFAMKATAVIAKHHAASGYAITNLTGIVSAMNEQFGVTADEADEALAGVIDLGRTGGLSVEGLEGALGALGKTSGQFGFKGVEGMKVMLAALNTLEGKTKSPGEALKLLQQAFEALSGDKDKTKKLKLMGIDTAGKNPLETLSALIQKTGGDTAKLTEIVGGGATELMAAFGEFPDASAAMKQLSSTTYDAAAAQKLAEENLKRPAAGIKGAIEIMDQAFRNPALMGSIQQLASHLPALAEAAAKAIAWIVDSPVSAGAALAGGIFAKGAIEAQFTSALTGAATKGGSAMALSFGGALPVAAIGIALGLAISKFLKIGDDNLDEARRKKEEADRLFGEREAPVEIAPEGEGTHAVTATNYQRARMLGDKAKTDALYGEGTADKFGASPFGDPSMIGGRDALERAAAGPDAGEVRAMGDELFGQFTPGGSDRSRRGAGPWRDDYQYAPEGAGKQGGGGDMRPVVAAIDLLRAGNMKVVGKVQITNAAEIAQAAQGKGGPAPGHTPRP